MKLRNGIIVLLALLTGGPVWAHAQARPAQAARPAASESSTKVAVINIQGAIATTEEGKEKAAELRTRFSPRSNELQNLSKQIQDIQQRIQDGERTLSDQEKARLANQGQQLSRQLQRKQQELSEDESDARNDAINEIGTKMMQVIDRYAREKGYSVVLDTSAQTSPVLYASNGVDITSDIVKLYNTAYPVKKAAAPTPKPKQ
jgi:outer membrane protein